MQGLRGVGEALADLIDEYEYDIKQVIERFKGYLAYCLLFVLNACLVGI